MAILIPGVCVPDAARRDGNPSESADPASSGDFDAAISGRSSSADRRRALSGEDCLCCCGPISREGGAASCDTDDEADEAIANDGEEESAAGCELESICIAASD